MCKIIAMTDLKKLNLKKHVNDLGNTLLSTEGDGFGYAVDGKLGVFGEKTTSKTFRSRIGKNHNVTLPIVKPTYEAFGRPSDLTGAGIFHGRTSTNVVDLNNTHPMQYPDQNNSLWHLIHNGVVSDHGAPYEKFTDNDSEDVLYRLMEGIESVEKNLTGYYAFAAIDPEGRLHICRDSIATLFIAWSPVYETFIFATTESLLLKVNKIIGAKCGPIDEVEDDVYMIFKGNQLLMSEYIKPRGWTTNESKHSQTSLGRDLSGIVTKAIEATNSVVPKVVGPVSEAAWRKADGEDWDSWEAKEGSTIPNQWEEQVGALNEVLESEELSQKEVDYYKYRSILDNMDSSYGILNEMGAPITLVEFKKMLSIDQEQCTIIMPDGTVLDKDDSYSFKGA